MKSNTFVTVGHIISEATSYTADRSFKNGFSKSWYKARVADAIIDMNIDRHYHDMVVDMPIPANLRVDMPEGMINTMEVYVGTFKDGCCMSGSLNWVQWKKGFNNNGSAEVYSSKITELDSGNEFRPSGRGKAGSNVYYANEQNGLIQLSPNCSVFSGIRFVGKGMGVRMGEDPVVPIIMERYCVDYVAQAYWLAKMAESVQNARTMYGTMSERLDNPVRGSRVRAKKSISKMSGFIKASINDYITNPHMK
jgi:hypothetical protein